MGFWHYCPEHGRVPSQNVDYWIPKRRNVAPETGVLDALPGRTPELAERLGLDARGVRGLLDALGA